MRMPKLGCAVALLASAWVVMPALADLPKVHPDFELRLVAAVPAVQFPCQVATGPDGALFIAENPMDMTGPADQPIDRILLFREGKEPVVFAERLAAVFGMAWRDDALYVMHMPYLSILRDKDGDGKAEERRDLFADLGLKPGEPNGMNDHIVSGIQFGMDGWLYISVGDKGVPAAHGPDGREVQLVGGGILRCRPDGTRIEVVSSGTRNHLEPNLDESDRIFTYDNTDDGEGWWTRVTHHIDGGYYGYPYDYHDYQYRMLPRIAEYGGGSPCGGLVYREERWPAAFRGRVLWAEWGKREVAAFRFVPDGATFRVDDVIKLVESGPAEDFRPLDLALSPDGLTLYVADWGLGGWGNKEEKLGRVYAVAPRRPEPAAPEVNPEAPADELIRSGLTNPSYRERLRAQRALARDEANLPALVTALADPATAPVAGRHLVWALDERAGATPEASLPLIAALRSGAAEVRAQSARSLGLHRVPIAAEALATMAAAESDPQAKLEAIIALGRIGDGSAMAPVFAALGGDDPTIRHAARSALRRVGAWDEALAFARTRPEDQRLWIELVRAMERVEDVKVAQTLARLSTDRSLPEPVRDEALQMLAEGHRKSPPWDGKWWGTRPTQGKGFPRSIEWGGTPIVRQAIDEALKAEPRGRRELAIAAIRRTANPDGLPLLRDRYATEPELDVRVSIGATLAELDDEAAAPLFVAVVSDGDASAKLRAGALAGLLKLGTDSGLEQLIPLISRADVVPEVRRDVMLLLGAAKVKAAAEAIGGALAADRPDLRAAAVGALAALEPEGVFRDRLRDRLGDDDLSVRKAAIATAAALRDTDALPKLVELSRRADERFEAMLALAAMPDVRALPIYLQGMADRSPDLRAASAKAVAAIRDEAAPILEELSKRRELAASILPELRKVYEGMQPVKAWKVLGPLPIAEQAIDPAQPPDYERRHTSARGRDIGWDDVKPIDARGQIPLDALFRPDDNVAAYGSAELTSPADREAEMAVGSDDTLTVWINGEQVYDFAERRSFDPGRDKVPVKLKAGANRLLVKCGNRGGSWAFSVEVSAPSTYEFLKAPATGAYDPGAYQAYAAEHPGDARRGETLFKDLQGLACVKCHAVAGQGGQVGPALSDIASKYARDEIVASVLYPSQRISSGYETLVVVTNEGEVISGVVKSDAGGVLELETAEAKRIKIAAADIDERRPGEVSIMPNGLAEGLTPADFADLMGYLSTLKTADAPPR